MARARPVHQLPRDSAASRAGGLLATSAHADLYGARFATLAAASSLGVNLASRLEIQQMDLDAYGINNTTRPDVTALGRTLIVTAKAFAMGLTSSVNMPSLIDDPHSASRAQPTWL